MEDKNASMIGGWLYDKVIYAGMQLLTGAFPHLSGFQNPILQVTNCFNIQRSTEFIQCLNIAGMHHHSNSRLRFIELSGFTIA